MTLRTTVIAAVFLAATLSSSASAQTINGCVKDKSGALRIVTDPVDCSSRETPISWNQTGPQGEPGAPGPQGESGADGSELHVFDANGVDLGIYAGRQSVITDTSQAIVRIAVWIYLPEAKISIKVRQATGAHVKDRTNFYFTEWGCEGTAYSDNAGMLLEPWENDNYGSGEFVVSAQESVIVPVHARSSTTNGSGPCTNYNDPFQERALVPTVAADPATELGLSFPLPAPLYVGLPPE